MPSLPQHSLTEIAARIADGSISSEQATAACLDRIARHDSGISAFRSIHATQALEQARAADIQRARGLALPLLHGVPLAHKDMFYRQGEESTCGSIIRRGWKAPVTAEALRRMDQSGSVTLGRLNMSEFAVGPIGLNAHYGPTRNPHNPAHVSGGSSSGPAAAVAAGFCFGALGSDTGASIRIPAAACGIVGLKPSLGRISTAGTMPLSSTLDVVGPVARTVADVALLTAILAAPADSELTTAAHPDILNALTSHLPGIRLGVPLGFLAEGLDREIERALQSAVAMSGALGLTKHHVETSVFGDAFAIYRDIFGAEASSFHRHYLETRAADYSPQVRARLLAGQKVSTETYIAAMRARSRLQQRVMQDVFNQIDVLIAPVLAIPVPTIADVDVGDDPRMMEVVMGFLRLTSGVNVLGLPALSIPAGFTRNGLPVAIQLIGPPWSESLLLRVGHALEQAIGISPLAPLQSDASQPV